MSFFLRDQSVCFTKCCIVYKFSGKEYLETQHQLQLHKVINAYHLVGVTQNVSKPEEETQKSLEE